MRLRCCRSDPIYHAVWKSTVLLEPVAQAWVAQLTEAQQHLAQDFAVTLEVVARQQRTRSAARPAPPVQGFCQIAECGLRFARVTQVVLNVRIGRIKRACPLIHEIATLCN